MSGILLFFHGRTLISGDSFALTVACRPYSTQQPEKQHPHLDRLCTRPAPSARPGMRVLENHAFRLRQFCPIVDRVSAPAALPTWWCALAKGQGPVDGCRPSHVRSDLHRANVGAVGSCGCSDDDDLHACAQSRQWCSARSTGLDAGDVRDVTNPSVRRRERSGESARFWPGGVVHR